MSTGIGDMEGCFSIGVVSKALGVHPQTVRMYEGLGFVTPQRTTGKTRLYSKSDLERLRYIVHLAKSEGVSKSGIGIILKMQEQIDVLSSRVKYMESLHGGGGAEKSTI